MRYIFLILSLIGIIFPTIYLMVSPDSCIMNKIIAILVIIASGLTTALCLDNLIDNPNR